MGILCLCLICNCFGNNCISDKQFFKNLKYIKNHNIFIAFTIGVALYEKNLGKCPAISYMLYKNFLNDYDFLEWRSQFTGFITLCLWRNRYEHKIK